MPPASGRGRDFVNGTWTETADWGGGKQSTERRGVRSGEPETAPVGRLGRWSGARGNHSVSGMAADAVI